MRQLFIGFWDKIENQLFEIETQFKNDFGQTVDEEPSQAKDEDTVGQLDKDATETRKKLEKAKTEVLHWRCLTEFIRIYLRKTLNLITCLQDNNVQKITFENLWYLFKPGDVVVGYEPFGQRGAQAYQVLSVTKGRRIMNEGRAKESLRSGDRNALRLQCFYLDYDGEAIDLREENLLIKPYVGEKNIIELDYYPKEYLSGHDEDFLKILRQRGEKFIDSGYCHGSYDGVTTRYNLEHISGEIFVDFKSGYEDNPSWMRKIGRFGDLSPPECERDETYEPYCKSGRCLSFTCTNVVYLDEQVDIRRSENFKKLKQFPKRISNCNKIRLRTELSDSLILLPRHLLAYSLHSKEWHFLDVDLFQQTNINDTKREKGFQNLVIPPRYKELLKAMVKDHATSMEAQSGLLSSKPRTEIDLVRGKGRGRIIFLYGPPGVGKTSTAETIAAYTTPARPLYPITCADLGSDPISIQRSLEAHFKLAHRWNLFLRTLEYYSGILFLTSNREGSIDEAFKSRIHMALRYRPIDLDGTKQIWRNILRSIGQDNDDGNKNLRIEFEEDKLLDWARKHFQENENGSTWNGRQIRNAFQSAIALASYDRLNAMQKQNLTVEKAMMKPVFQRIVLKPSHFTDVAKVVHEFEDYLEQCRQDDAHRQSAEGIRSDHYDPGAPARSAYGQVEPRQGYSEIDRPAPSKLNKPLGRNKQLPAMQRRQSIGSVHDTIEGNNGRRGPRRPPGGTAFYPADAPASTHGAEYGVGVTVDEPENDDYTVGDYDEPYGDDEYGVDGGNDQGDYEAAD
ncbi:MAG: hypothetical protein Q9227_008828 [Pyrenula ochraceoflavens]